MHRSQNGSSRRYRWFWLFGNESRLVIPVISKTLGKIPKLITMKTQSILILTALTLLLNPLYADQASLDELVAKEEATVDNEAVKVYGGTVGKLQAIFHIEWADDQIFGWYYYPSRGREMRYELRGENPEEGVITLQEFTPAEDGTSKQTANCRLTKTLSDDRISWEGKMNNTDGRVLPMKFSRLR